jgi:hypothetical protein
MVCTTISISPRVSFLFGDTCQMVVVGKLAKQEKHQRLAVRQHFFVSELNGCLSVDEFS